jgi:hypothetical protein
MAEHEHLWVFGGVRSHEDERPMSGTSARQRYLEDWFYCSYCMESKFINKRPFGDSYQKLPEGVLPK